jgi:hypothetical protein
MQKAQLLEVKEKGGTSMLTKVECSSSSGKKQKQFVPPSF